MQKGRTQFILHSFKLLFLAMLFSQYVWVIDHVYNPPPNHELRLLDTVQLHMLTIFFAVIILYYYNRHFYHRNSNKDS